MYLKSPHNDATFISVMICNIMQHITSSFRLSHHETLWISQQKGSQDQNWMLDSDQLIRQKSFDLRSRFCTVSSAAVYLLLLVVIDDTRPCVVTLASTVCAALQNERRLVDEKWKQGRSPVYCNPETRRSWERLRTSTGSSLQHRLCHLLGPPLNTNHHITSLSMKRPWQIAESASYFSFPSFHFKLKSK